MTPAQDKKLKAYKKAYQQTPQFKAYKAFQKTCRKAFQKTYLKAYLKAYQQTPKWKAYLKAYRQTPKYKAYINAYQNAYRKNIHRLARLAREAGLK